MNVDQQLQGTSDRVTWCGSTFPLVSPPVTLRAMSHQEIVTQFTLR